MGGMKEGTGDNPYADEPDEVESSSAGVADDADRLDAGTEQAQPAQQQSIPYKFARDSVKDDRTQRPIFLRDDVDDALDDLVADLEDELGEQVYKADVQEAAIITAIDHPDLVADVLREWGYDWD